MNWHDTLLTPTYREDSPGKVTLRMENPDSSGNYELILEVVLAKR